MPVLVTDPDVEREVRAERQRRSPNARDEVWEGVLVVAPLANNEHQFLVIRLATAFSAVIDWNRGDQALPGANVSDRDADWLNNHRIPDVVVYLAANPARNSDTHWVGGPDFAVEIISPGEDPHGKLDFYAKVNTREVLVVDRDPWGVELYQLQNCKLVLAGKSDVTNQAVLTSTVLPLTFQLNPGTTRPTIQMTHAASGQTWTA